MLNSKDFFRQQMQAKVDAPVYCNVCGRDVKVPKMNAQNDWNKNLEWEIENKVHTTCAQKIARSYR